MPSVRKDDKRFEEFELDSDEDDDEDAEFDREEEDTPALGRGGGLHPYLEGMRREELVCLVRGMAERHQQVREELEDRQAVSQGKTGTLVRSVRRKIREAAAERGCRNRWDRYGDVADYSGIQSGLAALLEAGCADEVLGLAEELLEAATLQAEESYDEGDTGRDVAGARRWSQRPWSARPGRLPRRSCGPWRCWIATVMISYSPWKNSWSGDMRRNTGVKRQTFF